MKIIALSVAVLTLLLTSAFAQEIAQISAEIQQLNSRLPKMLDSSIEFTSATFEDNTINYNYKLINQSEQDIDFIQEYEAARKELLKLCNDPYTKSVLDKDISYTYNYVDKDSVPLIIITLTKQDCR